MTESQQQKDFDLLLVRPDEDTLEVVLIYQDFHPIKPSELRAYSEGRIEKVENLGGKPGKPPKTQKIHIKDGWILLRASKEGVPRRYLSEFQGEEYNTHGEQILCNAILGYHHFEKMAK